VAAIMAVLLNLFRCILNPAPPGHASCSMVIAKGLRLFRAVRVLVLRNIGLVVMMTARSRGIINWFTHLWFVVRILSACG
jgi:hypothetical protein